MVFNTAFLNLAPCFCLIFTPYVKGGAGRLSARQLETIIIWKIKNNASI